MSVTGLAQDDVTRMRDQLFFEGPRRNPDPTRYVLLDRKVDRLSCGEG